MTEMVRIINRIIYNIKNNYATKTYVDNKIWVGTQAEYDALTNKDSKVLYCITE